MIWIDKDEHVETIKDQKAEKKFAEKATIITEELYCPMKKLFAPDVSITFLFSN